MKNAINKNAILKKKPSKKTPSKKRHRKKRHRSKSHPCLKIVKNAIVSKKNHQPIFCIWLYQLPLSGKTGESCVYIHEVNYSPVLISEKKAPIWEWKCSNMYPFFYVTYKYHTLIRITYIPLFIFLFIEKRIFFSKIGSPLNLGEVSLFWFLLEYIFFRGVHRIYLSWSKIPFPLPFSTPFLGKNSKLVQNWLDADKLANVFLT